MKDAVGNVLKVGDLVMLNLDRPQIFGRVIEVNEGGIITGLKKGGEEVRSSRLIIVGNHTIEADPRQQIGSVMALRDPAIAVESEVRAPMVVEFPN